MSEREPAQQGIPPEPNASDRPHDVLAAEEFAMPAPEAAWRARPVTLPPEPNPSDEPHDVLAAEEFAMPAPPPHVAFERTPLPAGPARRHVFAAIAATGAALVALRRLLRR
ncbi:MAG TPA: hypothetical protein VK506_02290 [Conexibacter sp.]|nr:hypothetical protein [Conexibacter sp.]